MQQQPSHRVDALSGLVGDLINISVSVREQLAMASAALADRDNQVEAQGKRIAELEALIEVAKPAIPPV